MGKAGHGGLTERGDYDGRVRDNPSGPAVRTKRIEEWKLRGIIVIQEF